MSRKQMIVHNFLHLWSSSGQHSEEVWEHVEASIHRQKNGRYGIVNNDAVRIKCY